MSLRPSEHRPTQLSKADGQLRIVWSDGVVTAVTFRQLRDACPCALCNEKRDHEAATPKELFPVLTSAEAKPLEVLSMTPVGNYAYNIVFSDGHSKGLYSFESLRELGEVVEVDGEA